MNVLPARAKRRVVPALAGAILASGVAVIASVAPASAHDATIEARVECADNGSYTVFYTVTAWAGDGSPESRTNPEVDVSAALGGGAATEVGTGAFNETNGFQFSGQFPAPASTTSIQVIADVIASWGNGFPGGQQAQTGIITPPECEEPPSGDEGCTPGYWKNHPEAWQGYSPGQTLGSVFSVPASLGLGGNTLSQALKFGGGSDLSGAAQILLRAATAAVLNASHGDVDYVQDAGEIIAAVNSALASLDRGTILGLAGTLDSQNNAGCPL